MQLLYFVYNLLWGDLVTIPLPGGNSLGLSLLVLILVPAGIYFTIRTRLLPVRLFKDMIKVTLKKSNTEAGSISGFQSLIVSTATRVGMGNLAGVVAAISAGGAGAVFWMWVTALLGASTSFAESVLAQKYREPDPLYGGYRGGPAQYIHAFFSRGKSTKKKSIIAILFALSGLLCWGGISQVIGNSVAESMENAFSIPPVATAVFLVAVSAVVVLRKKYYSKSFRYYRSYYGRLLLLRDYFHHSEEYHTAANSFRKYFHRSLRNSSDCSWWFRCSSYERR